ncbi:MAG: hypothetical protein KatS3mg032_0752 [Cyclobacteriaceae bacterium]|nr:MAG: hypothetical protein KatS3mg032_0752 [Cyclobacteriaceae bacterium]
MVMRAGGVEVFSNCDEVELFVDGKSHGKLKKNTGYVWSVDFTDGMHELRAVGIKQGKIVTDQQQIYYQQKEFHQQKANIKPKGDG